MTDIPATAASNSGNLNTNQAVAPPVGGAKADDSNDPPLRQGKKQCTVSLSIYFTVVNTSDGHYNLLYNGLFDFAPSTNAGKWTREEEDYVRCLIDEFKTGMMPLAEGTSLRVFLSKMLNCHPMVRSKTDCLCLLCFVVCLLQYSICFLFSSVRQAKIDI